MKGNCCSPQKKLQSVGENSLKGKFQTTQAEGLRPKLEVLPKTDDKITWEEFDKAVNRLKLGKETGSDGVPTEVFKFCPKIKNDLFGLISYIWDEEVVPTNVVTANFRMLYKNKGSREDPSKYRCIALLNHAYKVLSLMHPARNAASNLGRVLERLTSRLQRNQRMPRQLNGTQGAV